MARRFSMENAQIRFKNFSGAPTKVNPAGGKREFALLLSMDMADELAAEGWNVKFLKARNEDEMDIPYIKVKVNYGAISPKIYMVNSRKKILMNPNNIGNLDYAVITNVDITVSGSNYDVMGRQGVSAYVHTMYVTIEEDEFASKYEMLDDDDPEDEIPFE